VVFKSLQQKFRVRTHHNALRLSSMTHQTVGLAQARPNKCHCYIVSVKVQFFCLPIGQNCARTGPQNVMFGNRSATKHLLTGQ
jgi:hypothetical protein